MPRTPGRPIDRSRLLAVVLVLASLGVVASNLAADDADAARPVYFSGTLEEGGVPVDGTRDVTLRLYDRGTGGTQVCVTSAAGTQVMRGQFRMALA
jgi:hypothetical protein